MIFDTGAISALLDGDKRLSRVVGKSTRHHLPLIVIAEYLYGVRSSKKGRRLQSLFRKLEEDSVVLLPDRETADWYIEIRHHLRLCGRPIPEGDLWISALARQHALPIVSQDRHFDLVDQVERLGW